MSASWMNPISLSPTATYFTNSMCAGLNYMTICLATPASTGTSPLRGAHCIRVSNAEITIRELDPTSAVAAQLIRRLDDYLLHLYPAESNHLDSAQELSKSHVHLLAAFENERPLGCGAVKLLPHGYGEIKRMYVSDGVRGKGIGQQLLIALERIAVAAGYTLLRLETGVHQPEALRFFKRNGFRQVARFGNYPNDPLSVFMEKRLD